MFSPSSLTEVFVKNLAKKYNSNSHITNDRITGLPTLVSIFPRLEALMEKMPLALFYIDIENFKNIEKYHGSEMCSLILSSVAQTLKTADINFFGNRKNLAAVSLGGDDFLLFIDSPCIDENFETEYSLLKKRLETAINHNLSYLKLQNNLNIYLGYTDIKKIPGSFIEAVVYKSIKEATFTAKNYANAAHHARWQLFKTIIQEKKIRSFYQPIISLKTGNIIGFEALSRGPQGSFLESPLDLFKSASHYNYLQDLEAICHEKALASICSQAKEHYLFLNISPNVISSHGSYLNFLRKLLDKNNIDVRNIVLELTERDSIDNYEKFKESLNHYRSLGFLIAIDDAGAGYSSLQAIAEIKPEFVKIDMSLIRNIDKNPTKKALLETFVNFSYKIGAKIICEGIETEEELSTLSAIGCDFGQGYLIGRPSPDIMNLKINPDICKNIKDNTCICYFSNLNNEIGDIVMYQNALPPNTPVSQVIQLFNDNKLISGYAVCQNDIPIGIIMRDRLFAMLGTRYGYDLFAKKPINTIMDKHPLILPYFTSLEEAAHRVAERLDRGFSDYVIVTKNQTYAGIVSISKILDTLAKIQIAQAKDANPLSGLPGNRCIVKRITNLIDMKQDFTLLYIDLDNFKAFNDYYGFEHGDRAISLLAGIINEKTHLCGNPDDLIGHIGGDDFVVITTPEKAATIAHNIIAQFDRSIINLYDKETQNRGYIETINRQGVLSRFPIMTLSIAGVSSTRDNPFENHLYMSEVAAEMKKIAKSQKGSAYIHDRKKHSPKPE